MQIQRQIILLVEQIQMQIMLSKAKYIQKNSNKVCMSVVMEQIRRTTHSLSYVFWVLMFLCKLSKHVGLLITHNEYSSVCRN